MSNSKSPSPSNLDLSGIDPNQWTDDGVAQSSDVFIPLQSAQSSVDDARGQLTVNDGDTTIGNIDDKVIVSDGIDLTNFDAGAGSLQKLLSLFTELQNLSALLIGTELATLNIDVSQASIGNRLIVNSGKVNDISASAGIEIKTVNETAGEALSERDLVYFNRSDNKWYQLDANDTNIDRRIGYVSEGGGISLDATGEITLRGTITGFTALTANQAVYASIVAGVITQTKPSLVDGGSQVAMIYAGEAISTTGVLLIQTRQIQFLKRVTLANNALLTITHFDDSEAKRRRLKAFLTESVPGAVLEENPDANQDVDVSLREATAAVYSADLTSGKVRLGDLTLIDGLSGIFDNNASTFGGKTGTTGFAGIDFGVSNDVAITKYTIRGEGEFEPSDWDFQYSHNNSSWTTVDSRASETAWGVGEVRAYEFSNLVEARYWRLDILNTNDGGGIRVAEIEMMESTTPSSEKTKLSQTFTLSSLSAIQSVNLWLKKVGTPTGTCTLRIETVSGDEPTGILAHANASTTFSESGLGTSYADELLAFTEFDLSVGAYAIVLSSDRSGSQTDYVQWGADSLESYADGEMKSEESAVWGAETLDAIFSVIAVDTILDQPLLIGRLGAGNSDIESEYADASSLNGDTNSTFKNTTGASIDVTCIVEL